MKTELYQWSAHVADDERRGELPLLRQTSIIFMRQTRQEVVFSCGAVLRYKPPDELKEMDEHSRALLIRKTCCGTPSSKQRS